MSLLISTVLSGSRNRLAPLAELPWTMPGIDGAMLGADDEHVAAVAIGDDLLLQVLRRVLAAQVGLERAAQPRALLAQPIADAPQLRARIVHDLAGGIDLAADVGDLRLERRGRRRRCAREERERAARRGGSPAHVASTEARNVGERRAAAAARARGPRPPARSAIASSSAGARRPIVAAARQETRRSPPSSSSAAATAARRRRAAASRASRAGAGRRLREAADRFDDPIEFEGPEGAGVHGAENGELDRRQGNRQLYRRQLRQLTRDGVRMLASQSRIGRLSSTPISSARPVFRQADRDQAK